ncbi:GNAT family N-acetyltransferase [Agarivorans sp. MS3-6]|uniref:GNAT family N-acetyltransferase n=1 Tax=Agarivorans sp. TSD2052 TaxID=2937286 RepID=UPI00200FF87C|nr:GNAT family N-acetyltransferase [Agarivorans sp. TSD2052]UPW17222.1 GNAT family N-acetyltransferase [Agarivorans sp. TSD2052]
MTELVRLQALSHAHISPLMALRVADQQQHFVKPIAQILKELSAGQSAHVMLVEQTVVGFFVIDSDYPYQDVFALSAGCLLRSFFVGKNDQGKGYGFAAGAQLKRYLATLNVQQQQLALTVNCRNKAAQALYLACGFEDSGVLYQGGPAGPQHIYFMDLA